jgi:diguanylate cyclase (GGDEF)-like protein
MAQHDTLTGLPNRAGLNEYVDRALESCNHEHRLAVISIDLDGLKEINGMHGHCAGDQLLKAFARRLSKIRADGEFVARTGGDEFLAVKQFLDQASLLEFLGRLEGCLLAEYDVAGAGLPVGGHIGVALFPEDAESKDELIIKADIAMQRARVSPQQVTCFYEARMDEAARDRWRLTSDLGGVVERNELTLAYQVQKSIKTLKTTGYEALLRWKHPHRGMVSPADFIPLAEACGAIVPIGQWVLRTACAEAARWPRDYRIAVNISPLQLTEELPELVHDVLLESGLSPQRLELEITESAIIGDKTKALRILQQIKDLGVGIALDDFGTGYSSLDTLRSFPFDKIKLDRSFVSELVESAQARAIIRAVVALGSCLHIPILAEGVETPEQLALLKAEDCDEVQGYLFGRPQAMVDVAHQRRLAS